MTAHRRRHPSPPLPAAATWPVVSARLMRALRPRVGRMAATLARRFTALGLVCDVRGMATSRGWATVLSLENAQGLQGLIDLTLLDGPAVGLGPCVALDIRLVDACGEVVADGLARHGLGRAFNDGGPPPRWRDDEVARSLTTVLVMAVAFFDLLQPQERCG